MAVLSTCKGFKPYSGTINNGRHSSACLVVYTTQWFYEVIF